MDEREVDTRRLPRIVVGDKKLVTFVWPVSEGNHKVKVAVDPENVIAETDETNNYKYMEKNLNVESDESFISLSGESGSWAMLAFILVGLAGSAIAYAIYHFKNRY